MKRVFNYDDWRVWEQNASPMLLTMTLNAGMQPLRDYFGMPLWTSVIIFEENQGRWLFRPAELKLLGQKMIDFLLCPPYRVSFHTGFEAAEKAVLEKACNIQFSMDLTSLNDDELVTLFEEYCDIYYNWYKYGWFCEPVQFRGQDILTAFLEKEVKAKQPELDLAEAQQAFFTVEEDTFAVEILEHMSECARVLARALRQERLSHAIQDIQEDADFPNKAVQMILSTAESVKDKELEELMTKLDEHSARFYWKQNNYFSTRFIDAQGVLLELLSSDSFDLSDPVSGFENELEQIRKNKADLLSKKRTLLEMLPPYHRNLAALVSSIGGWLIDRRKRTIMTANGAFDRILGVIATRTKTEISDCRLLIPQELRSFVESPREYRHRFEERREQFLVYQGDFPLVDELVGDVAAKAAGSQARFRELLMRDPFIAEGERVDKVLEQLNSGLNFLAGVAVRPADRLHGVAAYFDPAEPIVTGTVRVIRDPKAETLKTGEILVATNTTPDYMDAIRRCKAIVTDWGSQGCHAAIVSRELGKPCIIGTNYASQVLRNGDRIRLDLKQGTVEVLKGA